MATTNITMRIDEDLKFQLQELLSNLGMDMTTFFYNISKTGSTRTKNTICNFYGCTQCRYNQSYWGCKAWKKFKPFFFFCGRINGGFKCWRLDIILLLRRIKKGWLKEDMIQNWWKKLFKNWQKANNYQRKIKIIPSVEIILDVENVILHQIGYLYMKFIMENWYYIWQEQEHIAIYFKIEWEWKVFGW